MFGPGEVVMLKSGGPQMTVVNVREGDVHVIWFNGADLRQEAFPSFALVSVSNAKISVEKDYNPFKRHDDM